MTRQRPIRPGMAVITEASRSGRGKVASAEGHCKVLTADEGVSMTTSTAPGRVWTMTLRRQKARTLDGNPDGYTDAFEVICSDCGDDPRWGYHDVPPRLQRIRGPYLIGPGVTQYEAHIAWHEEITSAR